LFLSFRGFLLRGPWLVRRYAARGIRLRRYAAATLSLTMVSGSCQLLHDSMRSL